MDTKQYWNQMVPELTVTDFNKSLDFYTNILGFKVRFTRENPNFAYLYQETAQIMIEQYHEEGWNVAKLSQPFGRGVNFQIELQDISSIYQRVNDSNIKVYQDCEDNWYQTDEGLIGQREFLVQDPDGYLLRFCQALEEPEKA